MIHCLLKGDNSLFIKGRWFIICSRERKKIIFTKGRQFEWNMHRDYEL